MRESGILLPVASLPSDFGIGDLGKHSYQFADLLEEAGIRIWQILPLNPLGYGNSPYQPYSSYAGDEIYIDLEALYQEGLLEEKPEKLPSGGRIDYQKVRAFKEGYLQKAYQGFLARPQLRQEPAYQDFAAKQWVKDYAVFLSLKKKNDLRTWNLWPKEEQDWILTRSAQVPVAEEKIDYEIFVQYLFNKQWKKLKAYCNQKGIRIMGDIPFYVGIDSLDVWGDRASFLLDPENNPAFVAGVPPDYFSATGQRWGNPIYNWEYMKANSFQFWKERLGYCLGMFDIVRIDHFRAFDTYWKIPASCPTAVEGEWLEAPGYELFDELLRALPDIHIVVEDLGDLRPEVLKLRDHYQFSGMNIIEFSFGNPLVKEKELVYTGTHDNQTLRGWYQSHTEREKKEIRAFLQENGYTEGPLSWRVICYAMAGPAEKVLIPVQDYLNLDDTGRINTPGTLGSPNWEWKMQDFKKLRRKIPDIRKLLEETGRE